MTAQDWPFLWSVRGRTGRRAIMRARPIDGGQYQYEEYGADGFTSAIGFVDRAGLDLHLDCLRIDYPSLRSES